MNTRKLLFSLTHKDFEIQTFRCGGKGGQNVNKRETGVRIIHRESGFSAECREEREQLQNKRRAFEKLCRSKEFKLWLRRKAAAVCGDEARLQADVEDAMRGTNIRTEVQQDGKWVESQGIFQEEA
jgi:peptide chain release factor 1